MSRRLAPGLPVVFVLGCAAAAPPHTTDAAPAPLASSSTSPPAVASTAPLEKEKLGPPPDGAAVLAQAEEVRSCHDGSSFSCPAFTAFVKKRPAPMTLGEEDALLALLGDSRQVVRFAAIMRLEGGPGPRTSDPARALLLVEAARKLDHLDAPEIKWLGRALGALPADSPEVLSALSSFVRDTKLPSLAGSIVTGLGVAHPASAVILDAVDALARDPRAEVRYGVLDAYAETASRDVARSCEAWARALGDPPNELRGAALLSTEPRCAKHFPDVMSVAEKRLTKDPDDAMALVLPGMCKVKATEKRALALATSLVPRVSQGSLGDPMRAIALCDPRGPVKALAPYVRKGGEVGRAAERALADVQNE